MQKKVTRMVAQATRSNVFDTLMNLCIQHSISGVMAWTLLGWCCLSIANPLIVCFRSGDRKASIGWSTSIWSTHTVDVILHCLRGFKFVSQVLGIEAYHVCQHWHGLVLVPVTKHKEGFPLSEQVFVQQRQLIGSLLVVALISLYRRLNGLNQTGMKDSSQAPNACRPPKGEVLNPIQVSLRPKTAQTCVPPCYYVTSVWACDQHQPMCRYWKRYFTCYHTHTLNNFTTISVGTQIFAHLRAPAHVTVGGKFMESVLDLGINEPSGQQV